jgi:hypothetical protein
VIPGSTKHSRTPPTRRIYTPASRTPPGRFQKWATCSTPSGSPCLYAQQVCDFISSLHALSLTLSALYFTRQRWLHLLPIPEPIYTRLPTSFRDDIEAGLSSSAFDLSGNVEAGDSRQGLDDAGKKEVMRIMKRRGVDFDEARRIYMQDRFKKNNIGADGIPRDPKFVSFS